MFKIVELVKIFDQFIFFNFIQVDNVTLRKFFGIVGHGLVYLFGLDAIKFRHSAVQQDLLVADFDNGVLDGLDGLDVGHSVC